MLKINRDPTIIAGVVNPRKRRRLNASPSSKKRDDDDAAADDETLSFLAIEAGTASPPQRGRGRILRLLNHFVYAPEEAGGGGGHQQRRKFPILVFEAMGMDVLSYIVRICKFNSLKL